MDIGYGTCGSFANNDDDGNEWAQAIHRKHEVVHNVTRKIHHQLITSCVLFPEKKEDEYIYVGDILRRTFGIFIFWKKRKEVSTRDRLIGNLLK